MLDSADYLYQTYHFLRFRDPQWSLVDADTKKELEWHQHGDGEFWMKFENFCQEFEEASICTLGPDFDGDGIPEKPGEVGGVFS